MKNGVGRAAHGDIQRHGVLESGFATNRAGEQVRLFALVIAFGQLDNTVTGIFEQTATIGVGRQDGAVTRQGQPQCFGETVHRVGGEHTRAASAGRARTALDFGQGFIIHTVIGRHDHRIYQV